MLRFILDGLDVSEPEGLRNLTHRIYYNEGLNGYLEQIDGQVSFYGSEYTYLRNRFFSDGCAVVPIEIVNGIDRYLGNIFLNDAEWHPDLSKVDCEIVDRSFLSLIDNNKEIKAYLNVPRSKNDVDISAFTVTQTDLVFKEHEIGVDTPTPANRYGVRVYDAFKFLVAFMSDGQMGFESDYFNPETDPNDPTEPRNPTLITGYAVQNGLDVDPTEDQYPYLSFEELYDDINKLYSISFTIVTRAGVPTLKIEPKGWFKESTTAIQLPSAYGVRQEAERESYLQKMKFGDSVDVDITAFYRPITFRGFSQEEYHLGGQCNTKTVLDLQLKTLIINTNAIQGTLPYGAGNPQNQINPPTDEYLDDVFLVVFDGNNETIVSETPAFPAYQNYNARLLNSEVANRWNGAVPFSIFLFLGANQNGARAARISDYMPTVLALNLIQQGTFLQFPSTAFPEGFDPNGNMSLSMLNYALNPVVLYNSGTTIYTAPINSVYTASFSVRFSQVFDPTISFVFLARFDSVNALALEYVNIPQANAFLQNGVWVWEGSNTFYCDANDRLAVMVVSGSVLTILDGSWFQVNDEFEITKTYDPASNWLFKTECNYPIADDWWRQFRADWHSLINVSYNTGQAFGYVNEIKRPIYATDSNKGIAEVSIVSKFADVTR
jgi:hypothetical protein